MKRGENGSINVAMEPSGSFCRIIYCCQPQRNPTIGPILYTISGAEVTDMKPGRPKLANHHAGYQSAR